MNKSNWYILSALVTAVVLTVTVIWFWSFIEQNNIALRNVVLGIAAATGVPILIWRAVSADLAAKASKENAESKLQELESTREQLELLRVDQISNRFQRAVEQFSSKRGYVRLSGMYTLYSIAKTGEEYNDSVFKILHARLTAIVCNNPSYKTKYDSFPSLEVIEIIDLLLSPVFNQSITLFEAHLEGLELKEKTISRANFIGCNLDLNHIIDCKFVDCELWDSSFSLASLKNVDFINCNLERVNFETIQNENVSFLDCDMCHASFEKVVFNNTSFDKCDLYHAKFKEANLNGITDLDEKDFNEAFLHSTTKLPTWFNKASHQKDSDYPNS